MKKLMMVALVGIAMVAGAQADEASKLKADMQKGMNQAAAAIKKKDFAAAEKVMRNYFAPEFVAVDAKGAKKTLDQWMTEMHQQMGMVKKVENFTLTCVSVKVSGNTATSSEKSDMTFVVSNPQTKKDSKMRMVMESTSKLAKKNGKWWCVSSKDGKQTMWMDGKEMKGM